MSDVQDLRLDAPSGGLTGDLTFGQSTGLDLVFISGADRVKQALQISLSTFRGEWFLNTEAGVPYFQSIIDGNKKASFTEIDALIKDVILDVADVNRILVYESSFDRPTRRFTVAFKVDTTFGPVTVEGITI